MKRIIFPALFFISTAAFAQEKPTYSVEENNRTQMSAETIEDLSPKEKEKIHREWMKNKRNKQRAQRQEQRRETIREQPTEGVQMQSP